MGGKVKAKMKILKVYKGTKKAGEIEEIEFFINPGMMCPDPIESTIDKKEAIWFQLKTKFNLIQILSTEQEDKVIKAIEQIGQKK